MMPTAASRKSFTGKESNCDDVRELLQSFSFRPADVRCLSTAGVLLGRVLRGISAMPAPYPCRFCTGTFWEITEKQAHERRCTNGPKDYAILQASRNGLAYRLRRRNDNPRSERGPARLQNTEEVGSSAWLNAPSRLEDENDVSEEGDDQ